MPKSRDPAVMAAALDSIRRLCKLTRLGEGIGAAKAVEAIEEMATVALVPLEELPAKGD